MPPELAVVLTVRMESDRFPGKVLVDVEGKPLMAWIVERLRPLGTVIVATTTLAADDAIVDCAKGLGAPVYRGDANDVVARVHRAVQGFANRARFIFRGLGDCPFLATEFVKRGVSVMDREGAESFVWCHAPDSWPVYGSREQSFSRSGVDKIVAGAKGEEREHFDLFFHRNRRLFTRVFHEGLPSLYFRPYRLELDWPDDLTLVRQVARGVGMLAPLGDVIHFLDDNPDVAKINMHLTERTGPVTSTVYADRRQWMKDMENVPIYRWDGGVWEIPDRTAVPIFCESGRCLLGYAQRGVLHGKFGKIRGDALLSCDCGSGRRWKG